MMISFRTTILFLITFVTPCVAHQTVTFPKPTGPHSIGTMAIEVRDDTRRMMRDSSPRRWMVQAFYPAVGTLNSEKKYSYMPGTLENGIVEGTQVLSYAKTNADPIPKRFPVIFFVPGMGGERQKHTIFCEELASQGYVVLSLDQPYFSNFVKFPDGSTYVLALKDAWGIRDRDYKYAYYDEAMTASMADIRYMIDHLEDLNTKLHDTLDKNRLILMGHSFGGNVANTLGFEDPRIKTIVDIDSKITDRAVFGRIGPPPNSQGKPVLFIRGMMQYQPDDIEAQLTKITNATLWLPQVQHSAFSDQGYLADRIPGFGDHGFTYRLFNWFFKQGPHFDNVDTNLGGKDADAWFAEYRKYVVDWLSKNVNSPEEK